MAKPSQACYLPVRKIISAHSFVSWQLCFWLNSHVFDIGSNIFLPHSPDAMQHPLSSLWFRIARLWVCETAAKQSGLCSAANIFRFSCDEELAPSLSQKVISFRPDSFLKGLWQTISSFLLFFSNAKLEQNLSGPILKSRSGVQSISDLKRSRKKLLMQWWHFDLLAFASKVLLLRRKEEEWHQCFFFPFFFTEAVFEDI